MWVTVRNATKNLLRRVIEDPGGIGIAGEWAFRYSDGRVIEARNQITQDGLNALGDYFIQALSNSSVPFWLALGTGTVAAAISDHTLGVEGYRKAVSTKARDTGASLLRLRTFLMQTEAIGTWTEAGIIVGGTSALGSGTLINRVVPPGGMAKPSGNLALTIECRLILTAT